MHTQNNTVISDHADNRKKQVRRLIPIFLNGFRTVLNPIVFIVFSYLVVRFHSKELWGGFVDYLLFFFLATLISNWGSKDFLVRGFSEKPNLMVSIWQQHFIVRLPLLLFTIATIPIVFDSHVLPYFAIWLFGGFINNAFAPIYTFKRDFGTVILVELTGFACLVYLIISNQQELAIVDLVKYYAIYQMVKALIYSIIYWGFLKFKQFEFKSTLLLVSLPFFLMGCAGFLQSKVDLYLFGFFHNDTLLGEYQIISGFFIFSQGIATILLLPYLKNIYRMKSESIRSLKLRMAWIGVVLNSVVIAIIYGILRVFFEIELSAYELLAGFFIGWPSYCYVMHVFYLFKNQDERQVLLISMISLGVNFTLSLVLLSLNVAVLGVLIANAVAQLTALLFYLRNKIDDDTLKKD